MLTLNRIRPLAWVFILIKPILAAGELNVIGLAEDAENNVKLTLSLAKENCESPEWKVRQLFNKAEDEIDQAMRALGYYHASSDNKLQFNRDCWQADFEIQAGPPVKIDNIEINIMGDAADDEEFSKLKDTLSKTNGSVLHHGHYEKMKSQLESLAMERGYLHSHFVEKTLGVDKEQNTARIKLIFDAGKRLYFGEIVIEQDILEPDFVHKFVSVKTGKVLIRLPVFYFLDRNPGKHHMVK